MTTRELLPGQRKRDLFAAQAKTMLAIVRPRDIASKTRRRMAADEIADHGVGPVVATRVLVDVGDVTRFADRNASRPGPAPHHSMRPRVSRTGTGSRGPGTGG